MKHWMKLAGQCGVCGVSLAAAVSTSAEVTWDQKQFEVRTQPGDEQVQRSFTFTNASEQQVEVTSVKSSCGCTTAGLEKTVYAPGEPGQIDVSFEIGDRKGRQIKKVVVRTDDPATPVTTLTLDVEIPNVVELSPRLLMWKADEPREPKTLDVTLKSTEPIQIVGVRADADGLETNVEEIKPSEHYRVTITPPASGGPVRTIVWLKTDRDEQLAEANGGEPDPAWRFLVRVDGDAQAAGRGDHQAASAE